VWEYPRSEDVLRECGMKTMEEYIAIRRQTVATYVATRPILAECQRGERKRGAVPHQWWWELPMDLDGSAAYNRIPPMLIRGEGGVTWGVGYDGLICVGLSKPLTVIVKRLGGEGTSSELW
jgi:hypothetical protein